MSIPRALKCFPSIWRGRYLIHTLPFSTVVGSALKELHPLLENTHAHALLENDPKYAKTILSLKSVYASLPQVSKDEADSILQETKWSEITPEEICQRFRIVSAETNSNSKLPFTSKRYEGLYEGVVKRIREMTDDQLASVLVSLSVWPLSDSPKAQPFNDFWTQIDMTCIDRKSQWDRDKVLYFIDLWHLLRLTRISNFVYQSMIQLGKKPYLLTGPQLVQVLFYFNAMRTAHKGVTMYNLEHRLEELASSLSLNELGIACLGFFKTQTHIQSESLLKYIMDQLLLEIEKAPDIVIASILKTVRLSIPISMWPHLPSFLDGIEPQLSRMSIQSAVHVGLVTTKSRSLHPSSLTKVAEKIFSNLSQVRLKDLEKVLYPLTMLDFDPGITPCVFQMTFDELDKPTREKEFLMYPRTLIAILNYLSLRGIFHRQLINKVLDMGYIRSIYGKHNYMIGREILTIDTCIELELKDYKGNRLPAAIRNYLSKRYSLFLPEEGRKLSKHGQIMLDIINHVTVLIGKDAFVCKYIVPNQPRADVVLGLNDSNHPITIPANFRDLEDFSGPVPAPKGNRWKCIVILTKNLCVFDSQKLTGESVTKLRHLKLLGYEPILIHSNEWTGDTETKLRFLQDKIFA